MTAGMSHTEEHALAVIRGFGGTVWVSTIHPREVRCGLHTCTFSVDTVRRLATRGLLRRTGDNPEQYELVSPAPAVPRQPSG